jgi:hypothetical protein
MGLFSDKKTIVVSSTIYNMAGPEEDRPNFLKSTIFSAVMSPYDKYLGETLVTSYLTGPGMKQRQMFNYAVRNDFPGLPTVSFRQASPVSLALVKPYIPVPGSPAGLDIEVQDAFISDGDYECFAEEYVLNNHPELADTDYVAEYNQSDHTIIIQFEGGGTEVFSAGLYDRASRYVVAHYFAKLPVSTQSLVTGAPVSGVLTGSLPSFSGYTLVSTANTGPVNYPLSQTVVETKTYSDGSPTIVTTTYPTPTVVFDGVDTVRTKDVYNGSSAGEYETTKTIYYLNISEYRQIFTSSETVVTSSTTMGVTETITTVTTGDFVRPMFDYQIDTEIVVLDEIHGGAKIFIYKLGTGIPALDALDVPVGSVLTAEFYPFIPIRLDDRSITHPDYIANGLYEACRKLYKKATAKQKFSELVEQVEDNEDLEEIDFAYVQYGVSLNTKEKMALRYMYQFFKDLIPYQNTDASYMTSYSAQLTAYAAAQTTFDAWLVAQANPLDPLYETAKPSLPSLAAPSTTTIQLVTDDYRLQDFDVRLSWVSIVESTHSGLGKVGAKKGDVWIEKDGALEWDVTTGVEKSFTFGSEPTVAVQTKKKNTIQKHVLYKQTEIGEYTKLKLSGLVHENVIYKGKSVKITGDEALDDEDESGFLIPLHQPTLKAAGLVNSTQLATANTFLVFNSYKTYKKKWYESFFGMLLIFIVVVTVAAIVAPGFVGGLSGALGTNSAVGAGLGFTGTGAIVAGALTNVVAGMLISMALTEFSTALFGEKWGGIVASIVGLAMSFGAGSGSFDFGKIFTPQKLLALTSALSDGIAAFVKAEIGDIQEKMAENQVDYERETKRIQQMMNDLGGNNDLYFNATQLTDSAKGNGSGTGGTTMPEGLDEFINRTTLTGSDIVDITISYISDYAQLNLTLPRI